MAAGLPLIPALLGSLAGLATAAGLPVAGPAATAAEVVAGAHRGYRPRVTVGAAIALLIHADCFDVYDAATAGEVAIAELFMSMPPERRLRAWMRAIELFGDKEHENASGFPPYPLCPHRPRRR